MYDVWERVWRHLNVFQYKAFIHADVPRVSCLAHGVRAVPWARPDSGFTLLFEAMVVELAKCQPVADVAEQVGEHDTSVFRQINLRVVTSYFEHHRRSKWTPSPAVGMVPLFSFISSGSGCCGTTRHGT